MNISIKILNSDKFDREYPGIPTSAFQEFNQLGPEVVRQLGFLSKPSNTINTGSDFDAWQGKKVSNLITGTLGSSFGVGEQESQSIGHNLTPNFVRNPNQQFGSGSPLESFGQAPQRTSAYSGAPALTGAGAGAGGSVGGNLNSPLQGGGLTSGRLNTGVGNIPPELKQRVKGFFSGRTPF